MFLLVGLGNPGKEYEQTRHNVGFMAVEAIAHRHSFSPFKAKFHGKISEGSIDRKKALLLKPSTYMNRSGQSVREAAEFYKIPLSHIIVFHDELDLIFGKIRVKTGGSPGGHNGLKDIDQQMGKDYARVRIGIDHPGHKDRVTSYVLNAFDKQEVTALPSVLDAIADYTPLLLESKHPLFMTRIAEVTGIKELKAKKSPIDT